MDPQYHSRFTDAMRVELARRYDIPPESMEALDGFESFIYQCDRPAAGRCILRVGHSNRRPAPLVMGEVEWINHLHAGGAGVARAIPSRSGALAETVPDGHGEEFVAAAFEWASGKTLGPREITPAITEEYGRAMGRIHALSVDFHPRWPRPNFDDPIMLDVASLLTAPGVVGDQSRVLARYDDLRAELDSLPRDNPAEYGMIHQDFHPGNFFHDDADGNRRGASRITLFDFDDCCRAWYAADIGITLFYTVMGWKDPAGFTRDFLTHFLRGYREEKDIAPEWIARIPLFLKLREIDLYAAIHRSFDVTNITHPWVARYMDRRQQRIEDGAPYIDFDFTTLE